MPQIIVTAGHTADDDAPNVMFRERVNPSDFESECFAANLVERLGWAVIDATEAEQTEPPRTRPITGSRTRERDPESQLEPVGSA